MNGTPKHKVFVSYHHEDQHYKDLFTRMMEGDIVDRSVGDGDIDDRNAKTDTIRQRIRDEFIREATVTVVLVGRCTWQRKHVDWEIGSSLRDTPRNSRCGLLGIILPNHPDTSRWSNNPRLMPPPACRQLRRLVCLCTSASLVQRQPARKAVDPHGLPAEEPNPTSKQQQTAVRE